MRTKNAKVEICLKNPYCISHPMRPGLKDAVKCILRIGSAHNKGGGEALDINIAQISHLSKFLWIETLLYIHL